MNKLAVRIIETHYDMQHFANARLSILGSVFGTIAKTLCARAAAFNVRYEYFFSISDFFYFYFTSRRAKEIVSTS